MQSTSPISIFTDGGSRGNPGHGASSFIVIKDNEQIYSQGQYLNNTTNNIAEYFAVLMAITWISKNAKVLGGSDICFNSDSELVVKQLNGIYKIKDRKLLEIFLKIQDLLKIIENRITFTHIRRENNKMADALVNETIDENDRQFHVPKVIS